MAIFFSRGDFTADVPQKTWLFFRGYFSWLFFSWLFFPWLFLSIGVAIFDFAWLFCRGYFFWRGYFCMAIFRHRGAMTCDPRHKTTCLASHCLWTLLVWPRRSRHLNNYCVPWVLHPLHGVLAQDDMDSGMSLGPGWHKLFIRHAILHLSRAKFSNHLKQSVNWQVCEALVLLRCPWQRFALNCV